MWQKLDFLGDWNVAAARESLHTKGDQGSNPWCCQQQHSGGRNVGGYSPFAIAYLPKLYFSELIRRNFTDTDTDL